MQIFEKFYTWEDNKPGGYYFNDDNTIRELDSWDIMNHRDNFEEAAKKKGEFAWFSYTHNIGNYFNKKEDRSFWLGKESHYDEDHFFFITDVPGFEGKKIAFQLRVSNHKTKHEQWEKTHSEGYDGKNKNRQIRPDLKADFCLNLIMNPLGRKSDEFNDNPAVNVKVCSIDIPFDYYHKTKEEQDKIDDIIKKITDGARPTISYDTIVTLFGNGEIRSSGPGEYREHNFTDRQNQIYSRGPYFKFIKDKTNNPQESSIGNIPSEIKIDDIPLSESGEFEFDGRAYYFDYDEFVVYPEKSRRGVKYIDKNTKIPVIENRLRLTRSDILEMVRSALKKLVC